MNSSALKPYFIRAIYMWCCDAGLSPYLQVSVDPLTVVPPEYVRNGEIVLDIGPGAVRNMTMGRDEIEFTARFNGTATVVSIPISRVKGIFAKESGQGTFFEVKAVDSPCGSPLSQNKKRRRHLALVV